MVVHSESLKSKNTTLPRYALSEIDRPASSLRVKPGAGRPDSAVPGSSEGLVPSESADDEPESWDAAAIAASTTTPPTVSRRRGAQQRPQSVSAPWRPQRPAADQRPRGHCDGGGGQQGEGGQAGVGEPGGSGSGAAGGRGVRGAPGRSGGGAGRGGGGRGLEVQRHPGAPRHGHHRGLGGGGQPVPTGGEVRARPARGRRSASRVWARTPRTRSA